MATRGVLSPDCDVCGGLRSSLHLGLPVCRACTLFYRRTKKRTRPFTCIQASGTCDTRKGGSICKSCRYQRFVTILEGKKGEEEREEMATTPRPTMEKLRNSYRVMSRMRETAELSTRDMGPATLEEIAKGRIELVPGSYEGLNSATRILLSTLFDFAETAIDDFKNLKKPEQWEIVRNFYQIFCQFESTYRGLQLFPDNDKVICCGMTTVVDVDDDDFFDRLPGDSKEASKFMRNSMLVHIVALRTAMREANLEEEEFIALLGLELLNTSSLDLPSPVLEALEEERAALLHELHLFYRQEKGNRHYAARIGELFMLMDSIRNTIPRYKEALQVFRLLDVVEEDSSLYQYARI